ncbi:MAG: outer membrane protein transport protein [Deltaproteobacteria bacterium]|nr:outer membrane protein transport protein [Deltaproteobacteria bacterium]
MGGAFIAVADDATAASWNPAGLVQLEEPEVSVVGAGFIRDEDLDFGTNPEANGTNSVSKARINYLSATYPFSLGKFNMVISANYQNLYDLTRNWDFDLNQSSNGLTVMQDVDYDQDGTLSAWGLSYSIQILPQFSLGVTLNFWEDGIYKNKWRQTVDQKGSGTLAGNNFTFESRSVDEFFFSGFNANLGILWHVTSKLNFGAVLKTPFTADIKHKSSFSSSTKFPDLPAADSSFSERSTEHEDLDMPMSYGIGLAYRFSDNFTASFDIYRTEWDDFKLEDSDGNKTSPISGLPSSDSNVDPTYQVRMGAEYLFIQPKYAIPLRAGLFYDPAPAEGSPDDYYGFSLGSGIASGRFIFDIAYQYRFGNNVGESTLQNLDFSQDVKEHTVYSSIIIHF